MLTHRANLHGYPLPQRGAIVAVKQKPLQLGHRWRRFLVESFPASATFRHCAVIRALDNGQRFTVSGFYCEEV